MAGAAPAAAPLASSTSAATGAAVLLDAARRGSLRDITTIAFGNPNSLPRPAPTHFFPSVSKAKRDQQRAARLARPSSPPPSQSSTPHGAFEPIHGPSSSSSSSTQLPTSAATGSSPPSALTAEEVELESRQRAAKLALASHGPFPSTSAPPFPTRPSAASAREDSSGSLASTVRNAGGAGAQGTKRRHREAAERSDWDAASELVRIEQERTKGAAAWGQDGFQQQHNLTRPREANGHAPESSVSPPLPGSEFRDHRRSTVDSLADSQSCSPRDVEMEDTEAGEDEDDFDDDDAASVATFRTGASTKSKVRARASDGGDGSKEPAKKRSRTLTTPAQTAVLNALLAKTRFPSTETREEVGAQIGMSARRVQIWFQNRRQSQKRVRDREAQDAAISTMPSNSSTHSLPLGHGVPVHPHYPYGPPTVDPYAAHRYPQHGQGHLPLDPRYGVPPPHPVTVPPTNLSSASHALTHQATMQQRPELSRQVSVDSVASRNSFVSTASGPSPSSNDARQAHPYAPSQYGRPTIPNSRVVASPTTYQPHFSVGHQSGQLASKLYFPHRAAPSEHSGAPASRIRTESVASVAGSNSGSDVKLPSLSALLNGPGPQRSQPSNGQAYNQQRQPTQARPELPPSSSQSSRPGHASAVTSSQGPAFSRVLFSPPPSTSFERLRISGPTSPRPPAAQVATTSTSPFAFHPPPIEAQRAQSSVVREASPDLLDVAMDAMAYRHAGRHLPARSTLPPLRSVLGDSATFPSKPRPGAKSEADKALMAPIASAASSSPSKADMNPGPPRLAPISTFPINLSLPSDMTSPIQRAPPVPFSSTSMTVGNSAGRNSVLSDASSTAPTRSSMASFEFRHPPSGSTRDRYQKQPPTGAGGWQAQFGGSGTHGSVRTASNEGSASSPNHRSSAGSSSRTSMSSEHRDRDK
ncbi:homeobox domain-containing protein [Sporobolomyces koalae]|uniref:homeobox domain-containing protein n=1 Tax=Sporobolomyces koalae TaxID=500713 RepID=UPI00317F433E